MMKPLAGKWALVTGASRGIGQQIAAGLADSGCNIILHARRPENCRRTLEMLESYAIETLVVAAELGDSQQERQMIDAILRQPGYIDILYNNAAIMAPWHERIAQIPMSEWEHIYQVNFFSLVRLCNAFYPLMRERGWGRIVNLVTGMENTPQLTPYSAAKASVEKFTRELAAELADQNQALAKELRRVHREIAALLGVTAGTSKAQLHRARMALRAYLGEGG